MVSSQKVSFTQPSRPAKKRRLFFALWPDQNVRKQIDTLNRQLATPDRGGRLMNSAKLHLTLHYIGSVSEKDMICLRGAAKKVKSAPFSLNLDRLGYFKRPKALWLGCEETPDGYAELLNRLAQQISQCGFDMEQGSNTPHVTLRRKAVRPKDDIEIDTINWDINQFVLVESVSIEGGVNYQVVEHYPLNVSV